MESSARKVKISSNLHILKGISSHYNIMIEIIFKLIYFFFFMVFSTIQCYFFVIIKKPDLKFTTQLFK